MHAWNTISFAIQIPYRILTKEEGDEPPPPRAEEDSVDPDGSQLHGSSKQNRVRKLMRQDDKSRATKETFSFGVAKPSVTILQHLKKLHKPRTEALPNLSNAANIKIGKHKLRDHLKKRINVRTARPDAYGWTMAFLKGNMHQSRGLFDSLVEVLLPVARATLPNALNVLLAAGAMTALNKVPESQQSAVKPKLRPVNGGVNFLKVPLGAVMTHGTIKEFIKSFTDIQFGVGMSRGIELVAHIFRTLYNKGDSILKIDIRNAFNELERSKMFAEIDLLCPCLNGIAQAYYGVNAPIF